LAFESVKIFRYLELQYMGSGVVELWTDLPTPFAGGLALREAHTLPVLAARSVCPAIGLSNTTRGKLYRVKIRPAGPFALYGARIYTRRIGLKATDWAWVDLPVVITSDQWTELRLPIEPTSDEWTTLPLPGIERTSDEYSALHIPIEATPDLLQWSEIPVDE